MFSADVISILNRYFNGMSIKQNDDGFKVRFVKQFQFFTAITSHNLTSFYTIDKVSKYNPNKMINLNLS